MFYRYAAIRTLRNSHRGPLTGGSILTSVSARLNFVPLPSYPHYGTIKSYRELFNSRDLNRCHTAELFRLLHAGHYLPGMRKPIADEVME